MANREQLALLLQGVAVWNEWREKNSALSPDLHGADLRSADLRNADLRNADLSKADLSKAKLSNADLRVSAAVTIKLHEPRKTSAASSRSSNAQNEPWKFAGSIAANEGWDR